MRARTLFALGLAVVALAACGDDDDDGDSAGAGTATLEEAFPHLAEAASRLEGHLKDSKAGKAISYVEHKDGELNIWTRLNAAAASDDKPAAEICRIARNSGVPEAEGAHLLDAGAEEFMRC